MDDLGYRYDGGQDGGHYPNPLKHFCSKLSLRGP